ncbi:hypothetical protein SEA_YOSIF_57 [Streptomyces phage Yosif]|uniref:Transglycosylase SLT domain-containing protein n=1 Tax=Streptomyces phage Yosif TaxID=2201421 RepID=A0A2Z4QBW0_9CAUD|nr:hypothetical protein KGG71_gp57 [Streptomyces phage Yosif]AWY07621.1 hypothetical protein SEA_YOSIF_57 [Streptomyces phage Yosif]
MKHKRERQGLSVASGVTALVASFSLGLLLGAGFSSEPAQRVDTSKPVSRPTPSPSPSEEPRPKPKPTPKVELTPKQIAKKKVAERGWSDAEYADLVLLWQVESGWNPEAQNPASTAYGIAQFLDSTWELVGMEKTSDPERQIEAGLRYIAAVYGTPSQALAFWQSHDPHWY